MKFATYSPYLTSEAKKAGRLIDKNSKIGLRADGTTLVKLGKRDWAVQAERVYERDKWECQKCGGPLTRATAEIDHVVPRGRGGGDDLENLQLLGGPFSQCKCHRGRLGSKHA